MSTTVEINENRVGAAEGFKNAIKKELELWVAEALKGLNASKNKLLKENEILYGNEIKKHTGAFYLSGHGIETPEVFTYREYVKSLEKENELSAYSSNDPAIRGGSFYPCATIRKIKEADKSWEASVCLDETGECGYCDYKKCLIANAKERKEIFKKSIIAKIADEYDYDCKNTTLKELPFAGKLKYLFSKKSCEHYSCVKRDSNSFYAELSIEGITLAFISSLMKEAKKMNITFTSIEVRIGESTKKTTKARGFYTFDLKDGSFTNDKITICATPNTRMFSIMGKNVFASFDPFMKINYILNENAASCEKKEEKE